MPYKVIRAGEITVAQGYSCPKCGVIWPYHYTKCPTCNVNIIGDEKLKNNNSILSFFHRMRGVLSRQKSKRTRDSKKNNN